MNCASPHPEQPGVLCDKDAPCSGYHASARHQTVWPGTPLPERPPGAARTRKGRLAERAARIR